MDWTVPGVLFGVGAALLAGSVVVGLTWWRDLDAQVLGCAAADCPMRGMLENERNAAIATTAGLAALGLAFHIAAAFSLMFAPLQPSSSRCGPAAAGFACSGRF